jgi:hypothetical protein
MRENVTDWISVLCQDISTLVTRTFNILTDKFDQLLVLARNAISSVPGLNESSVCTFRSASDTFGYSLCAVQESFDSVMSFLRSTYGTDMSIFVAAIYYSPSILCALLVLRCIGKYLWSYKLIDHASFAFLSVIALVYLVDPDPNPDPAYSHLNIDMFRKRILSYGPASFVTVVLGKYI